MSEEEIMFNKLHDIFKRTVLIKSNVVNKRTVFIKRTLTVIECPEHINVSKEKISL